MGHVVVNWIQFCLLDELMCLTQWNEADQPATRRAALCTTTRTSKWKQMIHSVCFTETKVTHIKLSATVGKIKTNYSIY